MSQKVLGIAAFLIAVLVLSFHRELLHALRTTRDLPKTLAHVSEVRGEVQLTSPQLNDNTLLSQGAALRHLDSLRGHAGSELTLDFEGGGKITLSQNPRAVLQWVPMMQQQSQHILLHLIEGDLQIVERAAVKNKVKIYRSGRLFDLGPAKKSQRQIIAAADKKSAPQIKREDIREVMTAQKNLFDKCYSSLLKINPQAEGNVDVFFEIESTGKVIAAKVHRSELKENRFENCVLQSVLRARFAQFDGKPKKVIFPLRFGTN